MLVVEIARSIAAVLENRTFTRLHVNDEQMLGRPSPAPEEAAAVECGALRPFLLLEATEHELPPIELGVLDRLDELHLHAAILSNVEDAGLVVRLGVYPVLDFHEPPGALVAERLVQIVDVALCAFGNA